jgi:phospholipid/cholesterol/gamma-HCH transport system substrate-binding protein
MKSRNWSLYLVAITVILCSLVLLAALTFSLSGFIWKKTGRRLEIEFKDATGIKLHSRIRYAGAVAGSVTGIRYLSPQERLNAKEPKNAVRVSIEIDDGVPPIPSNVTATLTSETILGEKFISLSPGDPGTRALPEGAVIQGQDLVAFDGLARSAQAAVENANALLGKLNSDYPELVPRLATLLSQGDSLLRQSSNLVSNADEAVLNAGEVVLKLKSDYKELIAKVNSLLAQGQGIATNADLAIKQVGEFIERADSLIKNNEADIGKILSELRVVSQNLKVITT